MREDGLQACDDITFMDDDRAMGATEALTQAGVRQVVAGIQYMGCQEAARKRRKVSQRNGAWAGNVLYTDLGMDRRVLAQKKWDKAKEGLQWFKGFVRLKKPFPYKPFLSWTGYLIHIALTYNFLRPYMKGVYLTANAWRQGRDAEGWPEKDKTGGRKAEEEEDILEQWVLDEESRPNQSEEEKLAQLSRDQPIDCPEGFVWPVTRLDCDLEAMWTFLDQPKPVMVLVRPVRGVCALAYGFVDASGEGFGGATRYRIRKIRQALKTA
jgi:hypothetical protein